MGKNLLIVIDMQEDFVYGSLYNEAAQAIIPNIRKKIDHFLAKGDEVIFTRDTHSSKYLTTQEGQHLKMEHCINGTKGWTIVDELEEPSCRHINKYSFGYNHWDLEYLDDYENIELVGTCTSICVVSNALIIKALYPEIPIFVDASCCACVSEESHKAALQTMKMCQIEVYNED